MPLDLHMPPPVELCSTTNLKLETLSHQNSDDFKAPFRKRGKPDSEISSDVGSKTAVGKGVNLCISEQDIRQLLGRSCQDAADVLGVSVSMLTRILRHHGIKWWPNRMGGTVCKPPDPDERNTCPTFKASTHEHEMVGYLDKPNQVPPDLCSTTNLETLSHQNSDDFVAPFRKCEKPDSDISSDVRSNKRFKGLANFPTVEEKNRNPEIEKGICNRNPSSTLESSNQDGFKELGMDPANRGIYYDLLKFVGMKEVYKSKDKVWTRFYLVYDPGGTEGSKSLIAAMASYLEFDIYNLDLTSLSSLSDLMNKLASIGNRSLILIQDFDYSAGMLPDLNANELMSSRLLEYVDDLLLSCGDERIIVFTTNNRDLHAAALRRPFNKDIYIHKSSPPPVASPDEGEIVHEGEILQLDSFEQNETEAAESSFKWAFQQEGLTTQYTAYPNPNTLVFAQPEIASTEVLSENMRSSEDTRNLLPSQEVFLEGHVSKSNNLTFPACSDAAAPSQLVATILPKLPLVCAQPEIASTEMLSENMGSSQDTRNLLASQEEVFLDGHIPESSNLTFPACSDTAAPSQLVATILHTSRAIPHIIPHLTGGSSETFQLGGQSMQSTSYPYHNSLVFQQPQITLTQIRSENMWSSEDWGASQQEPFLEGRVYGSINSAHQSDPIVLTSEKKDMGEGLRRECLTKCVLSLDDSTKQTLLLDFDAAENKAHLLRAYKSGPAVSVSDNKNREDALKGEFLEDLQEICGGRRDAAAKRFGAIYDPGFHTTDYLAQMSLKVRETVWHIDREREIRTQMCRELSDVCESHPIHMDTHIGQFWTYLCPSLCHSVCICGNLREEQPNDFVPLLSLRRSTLKGCVQLEKSPNLPPLLQIKSVEQGLTKFSRYSGGSYDQSASSSRWPIGLPNGSHIVLLDPFEQSTQNIVHVAGVEECYPTVSLPEKKMVRTLKRKYRTISVIVENHQQHQSIALPDGGEIVQLGSSVKKPLADFDATANGGFESCVLVSHSKRRCMTLSSVSEFYRIDSLAWKSFEVLKTLLPLEQPRNSANTNQERQIRTQMREELSDACGSPPIHMNTHIGRFRTYLCPSLCPSICIRSIFWEEQNDFVPLLSPRSNTFKGCVQLEKSPYHPGFLQIDTVEQGRTKSPRCSGGSTAQFASSSRWPIGLPDGGNVLLLDPLEQSTKNVAHAAKADLCSPIVRLPKKKMVRKSLKTKCRTMSLVFEDRRKHFGRRCEGAAKSLSATGICMKHGINRVSSVNRIHKPHWIHWWPFRQVTYIFISSIQLLFEVLDILAIVFSFLNASRW